MPLIARRPGLTALLASLTVACGASSAGSSGSAGSPDVAGDPGAGGVMDSPHAAGAQATVSGGSTSAGAAPVAGSTNSTANAGSATQRPESAGAPGSDTLAPGTCGVVQRISLPDLPNDATSLSGVPRKPDRFMARVAGGFAVGPWVSESVSSVHWLRIDADGKQTPHSTEYADGADAAVIMADPSRAMLIGGSLGFVLEILDEGAKEASYASELFDGMSGRFAEPLASGSLDGQRGLFMEAEISGHPPWLAAFASDGTPVGEVLKATDDGACYDMLPTEHGNAFSIIEGTTFHLREFSAEGTVTLDVKVPLLRAAPPNQELACPLLALSDTGFAFLSYEPTEASDPLWHLHRIARDGTTTDTPWPAITTQARALAVTADTALCVSYDGAIVQRKDEQDRTFHIDRAGYQIHSEAGAVFLDVNVDQTHEIDEVRCAD